MKKYIASAVIVLGLAGVAFAASGLSTPSCSLSTNVASLTAGQTTSVTATWSSTGSPVSGQFVAHQQLDNGPVVNVATASGVSGSATFNLSPDNNLAAETLFFTAFGSQGNAQCSIVIPVGSGGHHVFPA